jgi:AhpC/TSA family
LKKGDREMCKLTKCQKSLLVLGLLLLGLLGTVRVSSALDVGDTAPDFTLPATTGGKISLSQFRGKKLVLLEFYGADFSPV